MLVESEAADIIFKLEKLFSHNQVQLFLIDLTDNLIDIHQQTISKDNIAKLLKCLQTANKNARDINSQFDTRVSLWNAGLFASKMALPSLIQIEARSIAA